MKKMFIIVIVFCMFLPALVGCNKNNENNSTVDNVMVSSENSDMVQLPVVTWTDDVENTDKQ